MLRERPWYLDRLPRTRGLNLYTLRIVRNYAAISNNNDLARSIKLIVLDDTHTGPTIHSIKSERHRPLWNGWRNVGFWYGVVVNLEALAGPYRHRSPRPPFGTIRYFRSV
jgi:hypothetical protein